MDLHVQARWRTCIKMESIQNCAKDGDLDLSLIYHNFYLAFNSCFNSKNGQ